MGGMATTSSPAGLAAIPSSGSTGTRGVRDSPAIDTITDFHPEQGDKIDLADMLQGVTGNGVDDLLSDLSPPRGDHGEQWLERCEFSVVPAGDGHVTQQITLKDVDSVSQLESPASPCPTIASGSMLKHQHSLIIQHPG